MLPGLEAMAMGEMLVGIHSRDASAIYALPEIMCLLAEVVPFTSRG